jgi:hypothetical protein
VVGAAAGVIQCAGAGAGAGAGGVSSVAIITDR